MDIGTELRDSRQRDEGHLHSLNMEISIPELIRKRPLSPRPPLTRPKKTARSGREAISNGSGTFCAACEKDFSKPYALRRHEQTVHDKATLFSCPLEGCLETFKRSDSRNRHFDTQHGFAKFQCHRCGAAVRKDGLAEHMSTQSCQARMAAVWMGGSATPVSGSSSTDTIDEVAMESSLQSEGTATSTPMTLLSTHDKPGVAQGISAQSDDKPPNSPLIPVKYQTGPVLVPDSPTPFVENFTFDPMLVECRKSMDGILAEVDSWQYEETSGLSMQELCDEFIQRLIVQKYRSFGRFLSNGARPTRRNMYAMDFGAECALCSKQLGQTPEEVFQHARDHVRHHKNPTLQCDTCGVKFLYSRDLRFHAENPQGGLPSKICIKAEQYDDLDWVAEASHTDRQHFIDGLRQWENLQLYWFLTSVYGLMSQSCTTRYQDVTKKNYYLTRGAISEFMSRGDRYSMALESSRTAQSEMPPETNQSFVNMEELTQKFERSTITMTPSKKYDFLQADFDLTQNRPTLLQDKTLQTQVLWQEETGVSELDTAETRLLEACRKGDAESVCSCLDALGPARARALIGAVFETALSAGNYVTLRIVLHKARVDLCRDFEECARLIRTRWSCCTRHKDAALWYKAILDHILAVDAFTLSNILAVPCLGSVKSALRGSWDDSPLHHCVEHNHLEALQFLLDAGVPPDWNLNAQGWTALHAASALGRHNLVRRLLAAGATFHQTNAIDCPGRKALELALAQRYTTIANLLLVRVRPTKLNDSIIDKWTGLRAKSGESEEGSDDMNGSCDALFTLVQRCDKADSSAEEVHRLVQQGFDLYSRDILGRNLLHWACLHQSLCVARAVLDHGVPVNAQDHRGITPLMYVLKQDSQHTELQEDFVKLLLVNGAEVETQKDMSVTPLMLASVKGQYKIAELLLQHGAQVDELRDGLPSDLTTAEGRVVSILPGKGYTALSLAGMIDDSAVRSEMISLLLKRGADAQLASWLLSSIA